MHDEPEKAQEPVPSVAVQSGDVGVPEYPGLQVGSVHVPLAVLVAVPVQMTLRESGSLHVLAARETNLFSIILTINIFIQKLN